VAEEPVKTMHPFVAAAVGLVFLVGCGVLVYAAVWLVRSVPTADAAAAYQTTVWGLVGLVLSGAAGARLTGGDNPLARLASAVSSLASLVRR
jgi:hypothetical protein